VIAPTPPQRITAATVQMRRNLLAWRPWTALTQAQFNALQASGGWDPDTLYVITPQRVFYGGKEVWPGPWDGGIVNMTTGQSSTANPVATIPTTEAGNLVVLIHIAATVNTTANQVSAVTDSANQTWRRAIDGGHTATYSTQVGIWYAENSAAIDTVRLTASAATRAYWIFEVSGIQTADCLDGAYGDFISPAASGANLSITAASRSVVFAVVHTQHPTSGTQVTLTRLPDEPWQNFDVLPTIGGRVGSAVQDLAEGGATVTASWYADANVFWGRAIAAFRTVATEFVPPPPFTGTLP
jgi:hypothetical protein